MEKDKDVSSHGGTLHAKRFDMDRGTQVLPGISVRKDNADFFKNGAVQHYTFISNVQCAYNAKSISCCQLVDSELARSLYIGGMCQVMKRFEISRVEKKILST